MGQYGDLYGSTLYGPDISSQSTSSAVRKAVGKTYDVALAGVGLELAPGTKAYSKKAAQTFSYNVRSLFSSNTRLTARDLYFWNRLEHIRWDKGETYEPWAPDSTQPTGFPSTYYTSTGFDTSQPHKLVHLKQVAWQPGYASIAGQDSGASLIRLNENVGNTIVYSDPAISPPPIAASSLLGNVTLGVPGPIYKDPATAAQFDGATGYIQGGWCGLLLAQNFFYDMWIRPTVLTAGNQFFFTHGDNNVNGLGLYIDNSKALHVYIPTINDWNTGYTFPTENVWYYVAVTRDTTTWYVNVNGVLVNSIIMGAPVTTGASNGTCTYGARLWNATIVNFFKGAMANLHFGGSVLPTSRSLARYNAGVNGSNADAVITPSTQTYAKFLEDYLGRLFINRKTGVSVSTNGGATWADWSGALDGTTVADYWTNGANIWIATANDVYQDNALTWRGANPAIAGVTAGWYDGAQIYVAIGTSLYYVDPATGIKTQLYDTKWFTIKWIRGFNGKIWFGGVYNNGGLFTRLWTWSNTTLPPSPSNGVGAQVVDGSIPGGFVTTTATVYQGLLMIGGYFPYTSGQPTVDGYGAVYYVNSSNVIGQLFVVGSNVTGRSYQVNSIWGDSNFVYCNYNHKLGIGRYDLSKGAFSTLHTTPLYGDAPTNQVLAVCVHKNRRLFAVQNDGTVWREQTNPVPQAVLQESEFQEIMFLPKMIDGIEGSHKALLAGQSVGVDISSDTGVTWQNKGNNQLVGSDHFEFKQVNLQLNHWSSRITSNVGVDATQSPEIYNWSLRFSPITNPKHEWIIECLLPRAARFRDNSVLYDVDLNKIKTLWSARENGTVIEFIDRDLISYKVLILEMEELKATDRMTKATPQQSRDSIIKLELLEVSNA